MIGRACRLFLLAAVVALVLSSPAIAGTISVAWDPVTHPNLAGYRVHWGPSAGNYTQFLDVGNITNAQLSGLANCTTWHVAVKARGTDGTFSPNYSNVVSGWARPEINSVAPATVSRGATVDLTVNGTNFMPGATVQLSNAALVVQSVTVVSCSQLTVRVNVPAAATVGNVGLTVVNPDQVFGTLASAFAVQNAAPNGTITAPAGPVTVTTGQSVSFAGSATDPDNNTPFAYAWNFGDPAIAASTAQNPGAIQFNNAGIWTVTLTVRDSLNLTDPTPATVTVTVEAPEAPIVTNVAAAPVGSTTATITWTTDQAADGQVLYRPVGDTAWQQTPVATAMVTSHSVALTGLRPQTTHEYQVRSVGSTGLPTTTAGPAPFTTTANAFHYLRIEAEAGPIAPPAETFAVATAFGGNVVRLASGSSNGTVSNPNGTFDYGFNAPAAGSWKVWLRMFSQNNNSNAWFERVNSGSYAAVTTPQNGAWVWVAGRTYTLTAGSHVLTLGGAEALAQVDRILLTNDTAFVPTEAPGGDNTAPAAPTSPVAEAGDANVRVAWVNPTDAGPLRVVVRFSTGASAPRHPADGLPLVNRPATSGSADEVLHTGLVNGTTYRYAIFILDAWDNASAPATANGTPVAAVVPPPDVQNVHRTDTVP